MFKRVPYQPGWHCDFPFGTPGTRAHEASLERSAVCWLGQRHPCHNLIYLELMPNGLMVDGVDGVAVQRLRPKRLPGAPRPHESSPTAFPRPCIGA